MWFHLKITLVIITYNEEAVNSTQKAINIFYERI